MQKEFYPQEMLQCPNADAFYHALKHSLLSRLKLPDGVQEDRIDRLVVFSIKMQSPDADPEFIEEKLAGSDCHQTSYVVSKKCLLMMEAERMLNIHPDVDQVSRIETVQEYASLLWQTRTGGQ